MRPERRICPVTRGEDAVELGPSRPLVVNLSFSQIPLEQRCLEHLYYSFSSVALPLQDS